MQKTTALGDNREGAAFDPDGLCHASSSAVFLHLPTCGNTQGEEAVSALSRLRARDSSGGGGETEGHLGLMWGS